MCSASELRAVSHLCEPRFANSAGLEVSTSSRGFSRKRKTDCTQILVPEMHDNTGMTNNIGILKHHNRLILLKVFVIVV